MILNGTTQMQSFDIAFLDPATSHKVKITKRTEALFGPVCFASTTLLGPNPTILSQQDEKEKLKIEFIGDSITCGYGILGTSVDCPFTRETEDHYLTFGSILAQKLEADYVVTAWSGKGVVRNYGTPNITSPDTMVDFYPRILGSQGTLSTQNFVSDPPFTDAVSPLTSVLTHQNTWNYSSFVPDVIIIKLGANDYSTQPNPPSDLFINALVDFVLRVNKNYAPFNAPHQEQIFVFPCGPTARGPNNILCSNVQKVVQTLIDQYKLNAYYADIMDILSFPQDFGCGYTLPHWHQNVLNLLAINVSMNFPAPRSSQCERPRENCIQDAQRALTPASSQLKQK